jgi:hypothetical protein
LSERQRRRDLQIVRAAAAAAAARPRAGKEGVTLVVAVPAMVGVDLAVEIVGVGLRLVSKERVLRSIVVISWCLCETYFGGSRAGGLLCNGAKVKKNNSQKKKKNAATQ